MRRTSERPAGTDERSITSQLPLLVWFAISARSPVVHPSRSSRSACLRDLGSVLRAEAKRAEPESLCLTDGIVRGLQTVRSAAGVRFLSGYAPSPRWKCWCNS
eukprot:5613121-Pleurochrysis_carterae.AAC.1